MSFPVGSPALLDGMRRAFHHLTFISGSTLFRTGILLGLFWVGSFQSVNAEDVEPQERALKGVDVDGKRHRFAESPACRAVVVIFLSTHCPISNGTLPTLAKIAATYGNNGIEFYGVVSDPSVTREDVAAHRDEYRIPFPVLFDGSLHLRRRLQPTHTPQAIVLSPAGKVLYSGRIDDRFASLGRRREGAVEEDLDRAISHIIQGREVQTPRTEPVGCLLEDAPRAQDGELTYNRDIAPLIQTNCANCHRPGEAAPFPLLTFADVSAHARQIVAVTEQRLMPPWYPSENFGHFRDERRLTNAELVMIAKWVEAGKPEGKPGDKPPEPSFTTGWQLGQPDLILAMSEPFAIPADGPDVHQHFVLPTKLRQNRLVAAIEFRPGNTRVVHHASFYIDTSGVARQLDQRYPDQGYGSFSGPGFQNFNSLRSWLPGMSPRRLPSGTGSSVPARSDLVMEIHYQPSGKPETDQSSVGIYFAEPTARRPVLELQVMNKDLSIPAGAKRHQHDASFTLAADATLLDAAPHMHLLGREMKATATRPDGEVIPLVWVKDWNFNWQGQYIFVDPIRLPKGTLIDVTTWFDNSSDNPLNPHSPPQRVDWGEYTTEEMAICHFRYVCDSSRDLQLMNLAYGEYLARNQDAYRRRYQASAAERRRASP